MSEMLTRVGGAILLAESQWTPKSGVSKERAMALAAIEAMREPTETMRDAGTSAHSSADTADAVHCYAAMIDAALEP